MLFDVLKKTMFTGLGLAAYTKERLEKMVNELVEQGEVSKEEGRQLLQALTERAEAEKEEIRSRVQTEVKKMLGNMGVASQTDIQDLKQRIASLEARLTRVETGDSGDQQ